MKKIHYLVLIIFISSFVYNSNAIAQTTYADYKVDQLSDAQILQMIKQAEAIGYSEAQLEQMAAARGMKAEEIQKLRLRVDKLRSQGAAKAIDGRTANTGRDNSETTGGGALANEKKIDEKKEASKIFGAELFNNGNITFEPNLRIATPKGYIIGPDDKLLIDLNGDNEASYNLLVTTEGVITLPFVGRVAVGGLSVEQAISKIKTAMAKTYPALSSGRTSLAINLGNIRSIKVTITGNVTKAGTYTLSSLSTIYNALYASGGPSANGSFRNIQIIRNNKIIATVDVYNFLLKGIQDSNIRLQDQDIINIPVYEKRVEISGEVKHGALFELINNETLGDLINFSGGFTTEAYTAKIKSFQNTDKERKLVDITSASFNAYLPKNGDQYVVEAILDRFANRVEIFGAVFRPGNYELDKGLTLRGLIAKADGIKEDAFLYRGNITRLNQDNTQALISFDVSKIIAGSNSDIPLQREDKVFISSIFDLRDEYTITIQGEVRAAGTFTYADSISLEDVIQMAGGFREGATPSRIEISRRVKDSDISQLGARTAELFVVEVDKNLGIVDKKFLLKPFDIISVRNSEGYVVQKQVLLEGEVLYPGYYTIISKDYRISDIIKRAGGLTASAYADGASLKRPGPDKIMADDKYAINNKEEESKKFLNLKRAEDTNIKDATVTEVKEELLQSDLVGINLERIIEKPLSKYDLILQDGDVIRIPKQLQTVKVTGAVLNPNNIVYLNGRGLKKYINGAGGFTSNARKSRVYIKYANGSAAGVTQFLFFKSYPPVKPGAEILVPKKTERERLSAQAWIGIGTGLASLAAIVVSLLR